jgi:hypothetical protein
MWFIFVSYICCETIKHTQYLKLMFHTLIINYKPIEPCISHTYIFANMLTNIMKKVNASYDGSLLWRNNVFSMGAIYSNAYGD